MLLASGGLRTCVSVLRVWVLVLFFADKAPQRSDSLGSLLKGRRFAAWISVSAFALAILFIGFGYLTNRSADEQSARAEAYGSDEIVILSSNTRDIFAGVIGKRSIAVENQPFFVATAQIQPAANTDPVPRLKPVSLTPRRIIAKTIDMNALWLAEDGHYGFAEERDFTGGKVPLFTKYISPFKGLEIEAAADDSVALKRGESLYAALIRAGIRAADADAATVALAEEINIRSLQPGDEFRITRMPQAQTEFQEAAFAHIDRRTSGDALVSLRLAQDPVRRTYVKQNTTGQYYAESEIAETSLHYAVISGDITDSLFGSAERAGAPREIVAKLANLFLFDVDFQREIRMGDRFEAVYEVYYDEMGRPAGYGDVVFGRLSWLSQKREKGYYRYTDENKVVWFDADGKSARRLLMKTPIDGARITSGFGKRRHPVLGYTKTHKGVDFGARRGTPIMAAGDGKIERANVFGSYGKYVRIRHANGYKTAYAHMNGFGKGIKSGARVRQGQIIGYVGTTGRSTGPHLHYEVLRSGKQVNPMRIKVSTGKELKGEPLEAFWDERDWIDQLRTQQTQLVLAQN